MVKLTVRNLTNSPFDLEGGFRLPAMGEVTERFSDDYAAALRVSPGVAVEEVATKAQDPLDHDRDGKKGGVKRTAPDAKRPAE